MIRILPDYESLSKAASELIIQQMQNKLVNGNRFSIVLSGGQTPARLYEILGSEAFSKKIDWTKVDMFWGDERFVSTGDPRSNEHFVRWALIDRISIPPENVHPIRCNGSLKEAAEKYESTLRSYFGDLEPSFDLILLGLGKDGHTASLFPGSASLDETKRWVTFVEPDGERLGRITLTLPIINKAEKIVFVISGQSKAHTLRLVLNGPSGSHSIPARLVHPPTGELIWLADKEAASEIENIISADASL